MTSNSPIFYDLHIDLLDSDPAIWRRVRVNAQSTLANLHQVLVVAMGWGGSADYQFKAPAGQGDRDFPGLPLPVGPKPWKADAKNLPLQAVLTHGGDSLLYTYDLTRGWLHKVTLETIQPDPGDSPLPICLAGERHGPPEFCAGVWGYAELLDRLSDGDDPEFDTLWEQVGDDFDPEYFDLANVNQRLGALEGLTSPRE